MDETVSFRQIEGTSTTESEAVRRIETILGPKSTEACGFALTQMRRMSLGQMVDFLEAIKSLVYQAQCDKRRHATFPGGIWPVSKEQVEEFVQRQGAGGEEHQEFENYDLMGVTPMHPIPDCFEGALPSVDEICVLGRHATGQWMDCTASVEVALQHGGCEAVIDALQAKHEGVHFRMKMDRDRSELREPEGSQSSVSQDYVLQRFEIGHMAPGPSEEESDPGHLFEGSQSSGWDRVSDPAGQQPAMVVQDGGDERPPAVPEALSVCEVCGIGRRTQGHTWNPFRFKQCKYCLAAPSFHHGRCCPSRRPEGLAWLITKERIRTGPTSLGLVTMWPVDVGQ